MRRVLEFLKGNLWLIPSFIVLLSVLAAGGLIELDKRLDEEVLKNWFWLLGAGAEGARGMLSTIAGSAITVAGVVFSITIVVLSLASSQYSPRVLRNFMADWKSQAVLGGFLGIFAYCLVVLRSVRGEDNDAFVPSVSVLVSLILALIGIGLLIFFIHHIASSIRATSIVRSVYKETVDAIDAIYPDKLFEAELGQSEAAPEADEAEWFPVPSKSTGYLRRADFEKLSICATESKITVKMECAIGSFVIEGSPIAWTSAQPSEDLCRKIRDACSVGTQRTLEQDVSYGIRQLVDVALKGLSPGINDTTSANFCIDHLGAIFSRLADRSLSPGPLREGPILRVIHKQPTFEDLVSGAFNQLRQFAETNPEVLLRILTALESTLKRTAVPSRADVIEQQVLFIKESSENKIPARDRTDIDSKIAKLKSLINASRSKLRTPMARNSQNAEFII